VRAVGCSPGSATGLLISGKTAAAFLAGGPYAVRLTTVAELFAAPEYTTCPVRWFLLSSPRILPATSHIASSIVFRSPPNHIAPFNQECRTSSTPRWTRAPSWRNWRRSTPTLKSGQAGGLTAPTNSRSRQISRKRWVEYEPLPRAARICGTHTISAIMC